MEFCPTCGNMLQYEPANIGRKARLFCPTCPYVCAIENKIKRRQPLVKKVIEPIFSGADALENAPQTDANCPACGNGRAYFTQFQTRSADEPMTIFYRCCNPDCMHIWRED